MQFSRIHQRRHKCGLVLNLTRNEWDWRRPMPQRKEFRRATCYSASSSGMWKRSIFGMVMFSWWVYIHQWARFGLIHIYLFFSIPTPHCTYISPGSWLHTLPRIISMACEKHILLIVGTVDTSCDILDFYGAMSEYICCSRLWQNKFNWPIKTRKEGTMRRIKYSYRSGAEDWPHSSPILPHKAANNVSKQQRNLSNRLTTSPWT